ncbi:cytochrome P450 [Saccharata proteae CBS 121410]|uniref:Cytochrome P450 n=1 Tax=Saccharata proteae CBS 121410 TaxID=1314787 RepID=A0A9P4LWR2_9PEZI|nr:cytochrome P450 [Saccharata proteae CBS 121410]
MAFLTFLSAVAVAVIALVLKLTVFAPKQRIPKGLKPLPGPKGYPILGSVPEVPEQNSHIKFFEWGKQYGPIYQCDLAGTNHVWISTDRIARDVLSKKAAVNSDRPHIPALLHDNRTSAEYLPLMSKNPHWTRQRKVAGHIMRESASHKFYRYPELESIRLLQEMLDEPSQYNHALESFISRVTCRLAWGHAEASEELKQRARELLIGVSPTGALGNKIPFVMGLPDWLSPAKAWERRRQRTERKYFEIMQEQVRREMNEKHAPQSWMRTLLETWSKWDFSYDLEAAFCVGMHGIAGALTVAAPMQTFCLAMCYYPQFLPILHEELDRVCGDRLPRAEDRPNLPVLRAFIRECLRWRPPVPTGIPHCSTQDDEYEGYHIPAGSVMHPLEWAIAREPDLFPDPEAFNPLRWLEPSYPTYREPLTEYPNITNITQFGYGRRLCQGQGVADEDMLIGIGAMAWLFDIKKSAPAHDSIYANQKATISTEELATGVSPHESDDEDVLDEKATFRYDYPGAFPPYDPGNAGAKEKQMLEYEDAIKGMDGKPIDPTLNYSHLLIAKPLPFKFELTEQREQGEFSESRVYWGDNKGELGWGKV